MLTYNQDSPHLLIVDDSELNREVIVEIFKTLNFRVTEASNGQEALNLVHAQHFDAMLLDIMMPDIDGIEVCKRIREDDDLKLLPIILITGLNQPENLMEGLEAGANDYVTKPFNSAVLKARVGAAVDRGRLTSRLDNAESVLFSLARIVEARDVDTGDHCDRLTHMAVVFGKSLGLEHLQIEALRCGGILHDIGKLGIPDKILLKEGKLNPTEWEVMKQHTVIGAALISSLRTMRETADIVLYHHERMDGRGYPHGLKGDDIPLLARIFQIVDIYDALSSKRPYKPALPREKVIAIMQEETAKGWRDPELMKHFLKIVQLEPQSIELPKTVTKDRSANIADQIFSLGVMTHYMKA